MSEPIPLPVPVWRKDDPREAFAAAWRDKGGEIVILSNDFHGVTIATVYIEDPLGQTAPWDVHGSKWSNGYMSDWLRADDKWPEHWSWIEIPGKR